MPCTAYGSAASSVASLFEAGNVAKVRAIVLSEAQLRWIPEGRLLPIIGIINHLVHMEWRWIEGRYLGRRSRRATRSSSSPTR